ELVLHCGGPSVDMQEVRKEVESVQGGGSAPILISDHLPLPELISLMQGCDAFVLPTKGEGWGLPVLEAMACGLPCIVTNYRGVTEFANEANSFLIPVRSMQAIEDPKFYDPRFDWGEWAEPDLDELRRLMRLVYEDPTAAAEKARNARRDAEQLWSWE